jgi:hypothetical protein
MKSEDFRDVVNLVGHLTRFGGDEVKATDIQAPWQPNYEAKLIIEPRRPANLLRLVLNLH